MNFGLYCSVCVSSTYNNWESAWWLHMGNLLFRRGHSLYSPLYHLHLVSTKFVIMNLSYVHTMCTIVAFYCHFFKVLENIKASSTSFLQFTYQSPCSCLHVQLALLLLDFQLQALANCDFFVLYKLRLHYSCGCLICSHCMGPLEGSFWLFLQHGSLQMGEYEVSTPSKQSENVARSSSIHLPALLTYINYKWIRPDHTIKTSENITWSGALISVVWRVKSRK